MVIPTQSFETLECRPELKVYFETVRTPLTHRAVCMPIRTRRALDDRGTPPRHAHLHVRQDHRKGWAEPAADSFSYTFPEFSPGPAIFVASVDDALHAGEEVQILGGCQTLVHSEVKNMN
jgi:hypothetical protein